MYGDRASPSLVILGGEDDVPILGAFALEGLGLEADPVAKSLRRSTQFLLGAHLAEPSLAAVQNPL